MPADLEKAKDGDSTAPSQTSTSTYNSAEYDRNWALDSIGAREAWETSTGDGIVVAVLDTGIDLDHYDLNDNLWTNQGEIAGDGIDNDGNGFIDDFYGFNFTSSGAASSPNDANSHGTHVAGIIAAEANGQGVVGIAPDAEVMAVKVLNDSGFGSWSGIARGIDYAIDNGAKIINMSLSGSSLSRTVTDAVARAQEAGVIIVAAAGNQGQDQARYPAALTELFDNVISVAASTKSGSIAGFSNYSVDGTTVDLAAPGAGVRSTTPNDGTGSKSGTSMASPVVAAAAAVVWAANPALTYLQVIDILESTVDALGSLGKPTKTNGIIDLAAAIRSLDAVENLPPSLAITTLVTELAEDAVDPSTVLLADLTVSDDGVGVTLLSLTGGDIDAFEIRDGALYLRDGVTLDFEIKTSYTVEISVDDPALGTGYEDTVTYTLSVTDVDETPDPDPQPTPPNDHTPDAFAGLSFWYDTTDLALGDVTRLVDLSGNAPDAIASNSRAAEASQNGLRFDGGDVYRIADDRDLNTGGPYDGKTLTFVIETGDDTQNLQMLYEQGGATRGLSIYVEDGSLVLAGWNLREETWGVLSVAEEIAANTRATISLVFDAVAGTVTGWRDGTVFGTIDGAAALHSHSDNIGLGGVQGATLVADGSRVGTNEAFWTGALFEAAGHGRALDATELADLHAGLIDKWLPDEGTPPPSDPDPAPPPNTAPDAQDDGPFEVANGATLELAVSTLLANDLDGDGDTLIFNEIVSMQGLTATVENGVVNITDVEGEGQFVYAVSDGRGGTDTAVVSVTELSPPPLPDPNPDPEPPAPIPGPDDPGSISYNTWLLNLGDRDNTHVMTTEAENFTGALRLLNKAGNRDERGINDVAGRGSTLEFADADGLTALPEFHALYDMALNDEGGLSVTQIASDTLRFEVASKSDADIVYFQGAFVEDLLSTTPNEEWMA